MDREKIVLETCDEVIEQFIQKSASIIDRTGEFPIGNFKEIGRLGLLGIPYPKKYGGLDLDYIVYYNVIKKVAQVCASTAMTIISHSTLTSYPLFKYGSSYLREKYLSLLLTGKHIGAFALSEPNAGSDFSSLESTASLKNKHYILNGSKIFITNANVCDLMVVAARTSLERGMLGISLFLVEKNSEGVFCSGKSEKKLGMNGSDTGQISFLNVKVPKENLIGRVNFGFKMLHDTLTTARLGMAAIAVGISIAAKNYSLDYVKKRKQFGKSLHQFQLIKEMIADMEVNINAADLLLTKAVQLKSAGKDITKEASEAKWFASETVVKVTKNAIQIYGGYGYSQELPIERFFRDAKLTEIGDGTSEMHKLIIADEMMKMKHSK